MPRIPDSEIDRLKRETDLAALIRSRGIELRKHGSKDLVGRCPFHDDSDTPNLIVTPAKGLYHCMACGTAGNAIQFVEKFDGITFRHAFMLLSEGRAIGSAPQRKRTLKTRLECPFTIEDDDETIRRTVVDYYHQRLQAADAKKVRAYLEKRGLDDEKLVKRFSLGYADASLSLRLPVRDRADGAALRGKLCELGFYRNTGHEHLNGSLVVPILDADGNLAEMYGRKITPHLRKGTPEHLYLPGPHRGIFNPDALKEREIILCESILDALTFVRHGMENATCIYGTQGFTDELFEAIQAANLDAVRLAYDADKAGDRATKRDSERLQKIGVAVYRIKLPLGEDANSYGNVTLHPDAASRLKKAVRSAQWLGAGTAPAPVPSSLLAAKLAAGEGEAINGHANPAAKNAAKKKSPETPELVTTGEHHELTLGERRYRIGGLAKNATLDSLKITLRLWNQDRFHLDQLDLCKDGDRRRFCERAGQECRLEPELIKLDLGKLLLASERVQDARLAAELTPGETGEAIEIAPDERKQALKLLQSPKLVERLAESFDAAGIVGEQTNKLAAYLAATSRLLDQPLAVIIQSTSAAGKTALMEAVLSFFPGEDQIKYSAMTGQSLYYLGEKNLKHKILAIVEEEGAEKASYALKLLQSEGELTIASTGKDATTGRMKTEEYHVEGPVAIILTTTSIDIDEELMNRCLVLTVDESRKQTERIHKLQRQARTLEGLRLKKRRKKILTLLQNAQRLLQPVEIINPFADELTFTAERTRTRRDHEKYLTLIESVTLLHQHQRPLEEDPEAGPHIKTTLEDIAIANAIAPEVLGRSLDELPPQTRRLLDALRVMVAETCQAQAIDQDKCLFSRRTIRERTGWSQMQIRRHLERLADFEYVAVRHHRNGLAVQYELLVDAGETQGIAHVGLIDIEKLRQRQPPGRVKGRGGRTRSLAGDKV